MATSPLGGFADLSAYSPERVAARIARAQQNTPLDALIQGVQQGIALEQLPQQLRDQSLQRQLQNELLRQKLGDLQNPEQALVRKLQQELVLKGALNPDLGIQAAPTNLIGETIYNPGALTPEQQASLISPEIQVARQNALDQAGIAMPQTVIPTAPAALPETPISAFGIQTGLTLNPNIPIQAEEDELNRAIRLSQSRGRATSNLQFKTVGNELLTLDPVNGSIVSRTPIDPKKQRFSTSRGVYEYDPSDPNSGRILPGTETLAKGSDLTPSQRISAKREIRSTYDELPAKLDYFGKGQIQGSSQLKIRLDAVLNPVKGDFSKLNPQAKQTFVFALNKLRDPTSATLLAEASQIAERAGIGDRFNSFIANYKEGDPLPDQVAKDIYDVISQVEGAHRENLINELIEAKKDTDELGVDLTSIGVPKSLQDEVERRINNAMGLPASTGVSQVPMKTTLSSGENFNSEESARAKGFKNGDLVIINGQIGNLE